MRSTKEIPCVRKKCRAHKYKRPQPCPRRTNVLLAAGHHVFHPRILLELQQVQLQAVQGVRVILDGIALGRMFLNANRLFLVAGTCENRMLFCHQHQHRDYTQHVCQAKARSFSTRSWVFCVPSSLIPRGVFSSAFFAFFLGFFPWPLPSPPQGLARMRKYFFESIGKGSINRRPAVPASEGALP